MAARASNRPRWLEIFCWLSQAPSAQVGNSDKPAARRSGWDATRPRCHLCRARRPNRPATKPCAADAPASRAPAKAPEGGARGEQAAEARPSRPRPAGAFADIATAAGRAEGRRRNHPERMSRESWVYRAACRRPREGRVSCSGSSSPRAPRRPGIDRSLRSSLGLKPLPLERVIAGLTSTSHSLKRPRWLSCCRPACSSRPPSSGPPRRRRRPPDLPSPRTPRPPIPVAWRSACSLPSITTPKWGGRRRARRPSRSSTPPANPLPGGFRRSPSSPFETTVEAFAPPITTTIFASIGRALACALFDPDPRSVPDPRPTRRLHRLHPLVRMVLRDSSEPSSG